MLLETKGVDLEHRKPSTSQKRNRNFQVPVVVPVASVAMVKLRSRTPEIGNTRSMLVKLLVQGVVLCPIRVVLAFPGEPLS